MRHLIIGCLMALFATQPAIAETYKGYEMPPFTVVGAGKGYELRDYAPYILAHVRVEGGLQHAASTGFRALASYIFGGNATGEKIKMTVPVQQVPQDDAYDVSFMMPARFNLNNLPMPKDDTITFTQTQPERVAVERFSGYATASALSRRARALQDQLQADGLTILDGPRFAYYDDPFTLPWRRRNELVFVVSQ
jgi:hypothetical protein